jgi:hypothetical protein
MLLGFSVLLLLPLLCCGQQQRQRLSFNYGWRFHYGTGPDEAPGPNNGGFGQNITGT